MEGSMMKSSMLFECGTLPPPYIHLASTWHRSCDKCSRALILAFFLFHVLYWMQTEEQKQGMPGNEARLIFKGLNCTRLQIFFRSCHLIRNDWIFFVVQANSCGTSLGLSCQQFHWETEKTMTHQLAWDVLITHVVCSQFFIPVSKPAIACLSFKTKNFFQTKISKLNLANITVNI